MKKRLFPLLLVLTLLLTLCTPFAQAEGRTLSLWAGLNDVINKYLDQYTLADLLREDGDYDYVI